MRALPVWPQSLLPASPVQVHELPCPRRESNARTEEPRPTCQSVSRFLLIGPSFPGIEEEQEARERNKLRPSSSPDTETNTQTTTSTDLLLLCSNIAVQADRDKTFTESSLSISKISKVSRALALASPLQSIPNPYRGAQGRNWRCALLLRLPGSFVPPRPWHSTIPGAADRVQCRPAKSCNLQSCNLRRAPSQRLQISSRQSSPGQRRRVASFFLSPSCTIPPSAISNHTSLFPCLDLLPRQSITQSVRTILQDTLTQNHRAPNTPSCPASY